MTEARGLNFVDEERWSWSVSLQTQYYSTGRRILLVKPVIVIYLCEAKDRQMLMEMCTCINSPQTIIWWDLNHYYCNNRVLWRWDLLLRYIEVLKKTPFQILTKDMKTMLNAYRLCRMNTNRNFCSTILLHVLTLDLLCEWHWSHALFSRLYMYLWLYNIRLKYNSKYEHNKNLKWPPTAQYIAVLNWRNYP